MHTAWWENGGVEFHMSFSCCEARSRHHPSSESLMLLHQRGKVMFNCYILFKLACWIIGAKKEVCETLDLFDLFGLALQNSIT